MAIKLENVGIAVRDIDEAVSFFTDLGLTLVGRDTVSGEWSDTAVGIDGNHAKIAMLTHPDGSGQLELFEYLDDLAIETEPTLPNEIGMHRVAFSVDDIDKALEIAAKHGCHPLRGVANYQDVYKLTYLRGPSGIIVMLAQDLKKLTTGCAPGQPCGLRKYAQAPVAIRMIQLRTVSQEDDAQHEADVCRSVLHACRLRLVAGDDADDQPGEREHECENEADDAKRPAVGRGRCGGCAHE